MNSEFKKLNSEKETRYVLEDGATVTTGAIATVEKPLGELQRRAEPPKPRNFVAKNAKMGGAGAHKDKKKAEKQGDVKHKKPFGEGAVKELSDDLKSMPEAEFVAKYKKSKAEARIAMKSLSEGLLDPTRRTQLIHFLAKKMDWEVNYLELATDHELIKWYKAVQAGQKPMEEDGHPDEKEDKELIRQMVKRDALKKEGYGMNGYATAMGSHIQPGNGPDVSEDEDDVGQELGMAGSELYGIAKHAKELLALIHQQGQEQGLEAWQQSKITKAADYLTAVLQSMDYDANGDQGVEENSGISKGAETDFHAKLDQLVHNTFGKRKSEKDMAEGDSYMEALSQKLAEKIPKGASVDYYIKDFAKSTAPQFKNKNPAKRKQMAIAAWNDSKRKK